MQNPGNALSAHSMPRFIVLERDILMPIELQRDPNAFSLGHQRIKYGQHPTSGCCPDWHTAETDRDTGKCWGGSP